MESTIETVASTVLDELDLYTTFSSVSKIPGDIPFGSMMRFLLFLVAGALILSILGRLILGKQSSLNHSISSAMAILFLYASTIVIYALRLWDPNTSFSPLPFITFFQDYLVIMPVVGVQPTILSRELLSLIMLAFSVNLLGILIPKGKSVGTWYILRFLSIGFAMGLHYGVYWAAERFLPNVITTYAPIILLVFLVLMLVLGFLNAILGLVLTISNPIVGAAYTFFFSNLLGKQFTKAFFTAGILSAILFIIDRLGYNFIELSLSSLITYSPVAFVSLILWYLIGHLL